jgi:hypothetical protein
MGDIHQFNHRAMATHFEARIADEDKAYAAQAAQAAFGLADELEKQLSRFRVTRSRSLPACNSPNKWSWPRAARFPPPPPP